MEYELSTTKIAVSSDTVHSVRLPSLGTSSLPVPLLHNRPSCDVDPQLPIFGPVRY